MNISKVEFQIKNDWILYQIKNNWILSKLNVDLTYLNIFKPYNLIAGDVTSYDTFLDLGKSKAVHNLHYMLAIQNNIPTNLLSFTNMYFKNRNRFIQPGGLYYSIQNLGTGKMNTYNVQFHFEAI